MVQSVSVFFGLKKSIKGPPYCLQNNANYRASKDNGLLSMWSGLSSTDSPLSNTYLWYYRLLSQVDLPPCWIPITSMRAASIFESSAVVSIHCETRNIIDVSTELASLLSKCHIVWSYKSGTVEMLLWLPSLSTML